MVTIPSDQEQKQFNELLETLDTYKALLEKTDYTHHRDEYFNVMKAFRAELAKISDERLCWMFFHSKKYNAYKTFFRRHNDYYMRAVESVQALSIMTSHQANEVSLMSAFDSDFLKERYSNKARDLQAIDFTDAKTLVCVGCGPLPETILYIIENTPVAKVIGIDNNQEAVYMAAEIIGFFKYQNIIIDYVDGLEFDYKDADIVFIPGFTSPKNLILNRIAETAPEHVQILVDSAINMQKMLYEDISENLHHRLGIASKVEAITKYSTKEMVKVVKHRF